MPSGLAPASSVEDTGRVATAAAKEGLDAGVGVGESEIKGESHSAPEIGRYVHYDDAGADADEDGEATPQQQQMSEAPLARASSGAGEYSGMCASRMSRRGVVWRGEVR